MESNERYRVEGLVVGRRRDGKYRYSESAKQALIALCEQPGASVSAIAVANGINPNVVRRWLSLAPVGRALQHDGPPALLPVMLAGEAVAEAEAEASMLETRSTATIPTRQSTVEFRIECATATVRFSAPLDAETLKLITAGLAKR
ncbi:MAG TPA: transposase [Polyangiaceae bacterium]|nr:transposase [Polyangiaceae bacterium]